MGKRRTHISEAIRVLENNYLKILTVYEWADEMGYSRSYFCRIFKKEFGINPKDKLKAFRLTIIKEEVRKSPEAIGYEIAVNIGLADSKSLRKFLYTHFDKNLTALKQELAAAWR
ncbi:MAG: AraC family transcriptional regulator [Gracilimonas sp.]|uniref:helix-turn-helix domain-containing protein n=1 Tax=Gracilimonas sp. TaxID=1974203 RepID=UPI003751811B|nr:AraC family transcriptional regulator [Gracilimonas sp.]